jgi:hypothetical protein
VTEPHESDTRLVALREIAVVRTGDKSDMINLAVIPFDPAHYEILIEQLTCDVVLESFRHLGPTDVRRFRADGISGLNFLVSGVLDGGVSRSRSLDLHGKSLGSLLATVEIAVPAAADT